MLDSWMMVRGSERGYITNPNVGSRGSEKRREALAEKTMSKSTLRGMALIALLGTVCQFGSCLTKGLTNAITLSGLEFVLDNDAVFDLFTDGAGAAP